ncbi:MAG TPA: oxidoreductase [Bacteroidales bacterium]|nr:MAG: oxidoreductase [Bacteroidetes bacterium GWF2_33_38]OFY74772.1 MAG: oxidoreductase [Bacteroidetes bacterium RIFOXYA12_FULL_33_9]OFY91203.1 MAG: oxidoreductase [Bacteroidetes bacterium RIFOXYA2_FULL_33_7]HBF87097.1 oxidoreductase [Bacteroidales bacterium]
MKNFALLGVGGYIAKRHVQAIKETGNDLIAVMDKFDNVGFLDGFFPNADFFYEYERFDRHIEKLKRNNIKTDYVSICSPNYLHDSHIRFALRAGADAICEKPVVLNPWNIEALIETEKETGRKINCIQQLRLHPAILNLKEQIASEKKTKKYDIDLTYIASRGKWYHFSWKGDIQKSGGVTTNIGIHFFDMLTLIFGNVQENIVHYLNTNKAAGFLELENARVRWFLSIDNNDIPEEIRNKKQTTYRSLTIDGKEVQFSDGFDNLHTESYKQILNGNGFSIDTTKRSVETVYNIRNATPIGIKGDYHPYCKLLLK